MCVCVCLLTELVPINLYVCVGLCVCIHNTCTFVHYYRTYLCTLCACMYTYINRILFIYRRAGRSYQSFWMVYLEFAKRWVGLVYGVMIIMVENASGEQPNIS